MKARIPGANNGGNMMQMVQKMQENMQKVQDEVEASEFSSSAGGGAVEATVNGKHEILSIKIKPDVVDPDDVEMLEDMVIVAVNEAIRKASEAMEKGIDQAKGGLSIPGLF
ncbi:MAG: YbaB/EbfC family nucleoid-associated protein [Clostridiales bacterium]|nr:YbaB/EbfC family nucleoid-associated protein [Clostridiales bacterium]